MFKKTKNKKHRGWEYQYTDISVRKYINAPMKFLM